MISQVLLAVTGILAIWLSQDEDKSKRKFACLFGLAGQPFWFYSAFTAEQWGIFVLCIFYTAAWVKGFRQHWIT